jgi:hypothetical protein
MLINKILYYINTIYVIPDDLTLPRASINKMIKELVSFSDTSAPANELKEHSIVVNPLGTTNPCGQRKSRVDSQLLH